MFKLDWTKVKNALVWVVLTAVLGVLLYVVGVGDIYQINFHSLTNIFALAVANGIISIIKSLLTTNSGKVAGVQVK